ncbi:hydroxymethylpyrimidine/phosphomethylpyrimidine kinase [Roseovarius sp. CAU 1744]|uniref:bifunctional hydroxymethylpyrimidine kinase/phosphomethylpyrimidine kinase n=1 Tax=Roseovarius sp. CAU 1744 TaxID=3140368 RepID=UPI00325B7D9A
MKTIMIVGGTDSSGGAGLTRDALVARTFGFDVLPIVTAVTAQSNEKLFSTQVMPADLVVRQIQTALTTTDPAAIKIGMLGNSGIAEAVAHEIRGRSCPLVVDPVLRSSSGGELMSGRFPRRLVSQARLITPNLPESAALAGCALANTDAQIATQAAWFLSQGAEAVLIKGGHATGETSADHLFSGSERHVLATPRFETTLRGTGCALATAIACGLAEGYDLYPACLMAKKFIHGWFREAAAY